VLTLAPTRDPAPPLVASEEIAPWRDGNNDVCARVYACGNQRIIDWSSAGVFAFRIGEPEVRVWSASDSQLTLAETVFAQHIRPLVLQCAGFQVLHASAVAGSRGVVAFCGRSGAGKSTLAALLASDRLSHVADDAVIIDTGTSPPSANSLPLGRIVIIEPLETAGEKTLPFRVADVVGAAALTTVLTHAKVFDVESAGAALVDAYAQLINAVPVTTISFQHDAARIPELVDFVRTTIPELRA
jgi:hypothetical protein